MTFLNLSEQSLSVSPFGVKFLAKLEFVLVLLGRQDHSHRDTGLFKTHFKTTVSPAVVCTSLDN